MTVLARELRKWDVLALVINSVIGAGIFGLPSAVFALVGGYSVLAYIVSAIATFLIILCFVEVGSRFSASGGPYLYARAAFGPLIAFEVGWLLWLSRCTAFAALCNLLIGYLDYFVPGIGGGIWRAMTSVIVTTALVIVNVAGVRSTARVTNALTIAKLVPLLVVAAAGLLLMGPHRDALGALPAHASFSQAALLLVFVYMGFEAAAVPAGEIRDPARHLAFGLVVGFTLVVILYIALQWVCIALVPDLARSQRPLADAAVATFGAHGASLVALGALLSIAGTLNSITFATPRLLFAMSEQHQLPAVFARTHPRYRTPTVSTLVTAAVALTLTLLSTFLSALTISTVTRLIAYAVTCAALPALRRRTHTAAPVRVPAGSSIAALALVLTVWLLSGSSWPEIRLVLVTVVIGVVIYVPCTSASAVAPEVVCAPADTTSWKG